MKQLAHQVRVIKKIVELSRMLLPTTSRLSCLLTIHLRPTSLTSSLSSTCCWLYCYSIDCIMSIESKLSIFTLITLLHPEEMSLLSRYEFQQVHSVFGLLHFFKLCIAREHIERLLCVFSICV